MESVKPATAELRIAGMDCQSCVVAIEAGLGQVAGVEVVRVNLNAGVVELSYDPRRTTLGELGERVEELGFPLSKDGDAARRSLIPTSLVLMAIGAALPLLILFRDTAGYTPHAVYVPGGLEPGRFDSVSLFPIGLAFLLGVLVFFSPTILAMSSVVVGYAASASGHARMSALKTAAGFSLGIVLVDAMMGALFAAGGREVIRFFTDRLAIWNLLLALTLGATGLILLRVWKLNLPTFMPRIGQVRGFTGALVVGAPFGLLDCPGCTPLLLPVALGAAATGEPLYGAAVLGAYGLGRGVLLMSLGASSGFAKQAMGFRHHLPVVEAITGIVLLGGGLYFLKESMRMATMFGF